MRRQRKKIGTIHEDAKRPRALFLFSPFFYPAVEVNTARHDSWRPLTDITPSKNSHVLDAHVRITAWHTACSRTATWHPLKGVGTMISRVGIGLLRCFNPKIMQYRTYLNGYEFTTTPPPRTPDTGMLRWWGHRAERPTPSAHIYNHQNCISVSVLTLVRVVQVFFLDVGYIWNPQTPRVSWKSLVFSGSFVRSTGTHSPAML